MIVLSKRQTKCYICDRSYVSCINCLDAPRLCTCTYREGIVPEWFCHECKHIFSFDPWAAEDDLDEKERLIEEMFAQNDAAVNEILDMWMDDKDEPLTPPVKKTRTPPKPPPIPKYEILPSTSTGPDTFKYKGYVSPYAGTNAYDDWDIGYSGWSGGCRHYGEKVILPGDYKTEVYCSSHKTGDKLLDNKPDFGIYFASSWNPLWLAYYVPWTDRGLPHAYGPAAEALIDGWLKALNGLKVEIGCIGGHGRTGTALACFAVLEGLTSKEAIEWVKKEYCSHAIESDKQEWWVSWFEAYANNAPLPEEPKWPTYTPKPVTPATPKPAQAALPLGPAQKTAPPNPYKPSEEVHVGQHDIKGYNGPYCKSCVEYNADWDGALVPYAW